MTTLEELKKALLKDFIKLYKPRYTTNWQEERVVVEAEIEIMDLANLVALIADKERGAREQAVLDLHKVDLEWQIGKHLTIHFIPKHILIVAAKKLSLQEGKE